MVRIAGLRCAQLRVSRAHISTDMTNAFACCLHHSLEERDEQFLAAQDVQLAHNYRRRMFLKLEAVDEPVEGLARQGVLMGSKVVLGDIMDDFQHSVSEWQLRQGVEPRFLARSPLLPGLPADLSVAFYADDGWKIRILEQGTAREAACVVGEALLDFQGCLAPRGYGLNRRKTVVLPRLKNYAENRKYMRAGHEYAVAHQRRHLGNMFSLLPSNRSEVTKRIQECNRCWSELRYFWTARVTWWRSCSRAATTSAWTRPS